ncbi:MAG TPA: HDOD domain-containing protein [Paucimonas sp.]|nr:HDOD domain-containing protein [Paucimonas sp.]
MTTSQPLSDPKKTLDLLWSRVRQRGDLPGFSKVVGAILAAMRGEDDREFNMTKTVLSDPALTQKVLRLANSPMYAVFGGGINTVSKAVIVLGTEAIGHLALGLKLIDGLTTASAGSDNARAEMEKAVLAGHIARQIAASASSRDAEEAVVCSMLHSLGRMMVTFYLPERWTAIQARCAEGMDETSAAREALGLGLDEIGQRIAQQWGLPASLVNSLQHIKPKSTVEPLDHADWLAAISTMSACCADVLHQDHATASEQISAIAGDFAEMLGLDAEQVCSAVDAAKATAVEEAVLTRPVKAAGASGGKPANAAQILASGVADMRSALSNSSTAQLLTMGLETVYKGLGLTRAAAFLRNQDEARYAARMCFGEGVQELLPRLYFSDAYQPDVFHAALANDKMIFVEKAREQNFLNKLPRWWKDIFTTSASFIVLPLAVNRQPVGFIYGDWDPDAAPAKIESGEVVPLNELRALVVHAIENRRRMDGTLIRKIL